MKKAKKFRVKGVNVYSKNVGALGMGYRELFVSQPNVFSGFQKAFEKADYVVLGVPFDVTSTFRTGARFGPNAVRAASINIETYSFRSGVDVEDLRIHDLGDLHVSTDTEQTLERLAKVIREIRETGKIPTVVGGEHTITLGVLKGLSDDFSQTIIVSFDAHLDLRDEFMGLKLSHTTFMRRVNEQLKPAAILEVGTRAVCKEELEYSKKAGITFFTTHQIKKMGSEKAAKQLLKKLEGCKNVYLSIDMDVLDPSYAPAVQNPEPDGLDISTLLDVLGSFCDKRVIGFDVVEVAPNYDQGVTATQAAKVIFEVLCSIEKSRQR
ncbi:MAG: agmatinase [Candidatus Bathyarchaeota archaeon]|nr:agmatinase [Candidatus Bathyarchaeota archaeon]MDW8039855.1 agmatinase [Nitrososphaerota archaeon]